MVLPIIKRGEVVMEKEDEYPNMVVRLIKHGISCVCLVLLGMVGCDAYEAKFEAQESLAEIRAFIYFTNKVLYAQEN